MDDSKFKQLLINLKILNDDLRRINNKLNSAPKVEDSTRVYKTAEEWDAMRKDTKLALSYCKKGEENNLLTFPVLSDRVKL